MTAPLVSVVMSVFNGEACLGAAVESILNQEGVELEVVIVNDGSTDGSGSILDALAASESRLRVIHQGNGGLTRALIRGCNEARGDFIARQDADDISLPGRLTQQARALGSDDSLSFVACTARAMAPGGERLWEIRRSGDPVEATNRLLLCREGPPCHGSVMFRKAAYEAVGGYRWQFWFAQDSDLWLRMAERGGFRCLPECLYQLGIGEGSISSRYRRVQNEFGELGHACRRRRLQGESERPTLAEAEELTQRLASGGLGRGRRGSCAYMIGRWLLAERNPAAIRYLLRATKSEPWNLKAWLSLVRARRTLGPKAVAP
jgi:glycosyltransferase involved in cell wall biosynthesis